MKRKGNCLRNFIKINSQDNVAVSLVEIEKETAVIIEGKQIIIKEVIMQGHKFSLCNILKGETIVKYGYQIGIAKETILQGSLVHTHNIRTALDNSVNYQYAPQYEQLLETEERFFMGYERANEKIGVRNEIWVIPTVGCVNNVASAIANKSSYLIKGEINAIVAFPHPYGCSQMGEDQENTKKILADMINHPNAGGVLVIGLGCENCGVDELKKYVGEYDEKRVKFIISQDCEDEIERALESVEELASYAGEQVRTKISCKKLIVGMKCGGSDGLSGITANPTVGAFSDLLISKGGTTILTEVPEMFGAETILMNRCETEELFKQTVRLVNDFKHYYISNNQPIYDNPSPGNKQGGISTLEDKSLGCTQKAGYSAVKGVLKYGEVVISKGLNLLSAPGNDLVATTALMASGAHIVLFTTGRGTPFASPIPTIKISSNTNLMKTKPRWIDFDCGKLLETISLDNISSELFEYVIDVASGQKVKTELMGFHDMAIFKSGITL